jgi:hypothetical protein
VRDQSPIPDQILHKGWDGFCKEFPLLRQIKDLSGRQIDSNPASIFSSYRLIESPKEQEVGGVW